ncbi:MAG: SPOR domain-containing protein [Deltaproteobacteria bacterium]|nr:SPOR domain-containing protein [Deltaproteobacteria bacterium]
MRSIRWPRWGVLLLVLFIWAGGAGCAGTQQDAALRAQEAQAHYAKAMSFKAAGQLDQAAEELHLAVTTDPTLYQGYHQLGLVYRDRGNYAEAAQTWQSGIHQAQYGPEREEYPRVKAIAEMRADLVALQEMPPPPPRAPAPAPPAGPTAAKPSPGPAGWQVGGQTAAASAAAASHKAKSGKASKSGKGYAVLFSSNQNAANAAGDVKLLAKHGFKARIDVVKVKGKVWHRVVVGCCGSQAKARKLAADLTKKTGHKGVAVVRLR